ncbi:hypothetical protein HRR83_000964 [Exophiala dermatitidis]|uniref:FAD-binding FR-type domain-containing protein n=1 Tax=Exophiala dermatitidis TaxID=5970 RepID=A0AAN6F4J2_EXODE|nr:hypothetical protein HRR75_000877 [Exophiala dermatitidis]KAJ4528213.1 hypothetical protein HRR74_000968 [Exophiala dermatitidis]KAJ4528846.1 hypothetical protein HRR73_001469 [Exophiala dermatitidis]KAJ4530237.1 hypothetical protein HRR76_009465 [Exophiala dermatitidis]KAJ4553173.1 hypothetical protein HRR78_003432 [Exophiala dermatitidis]
MDEVLPPEFLDALRLSLKPSAALVATLEEPPRAPENGHVRELIEAILWHRKFVLTYYVVLALLVALTGAHGLYNKRVRRARQDKKRYKPIPDTPSSSSSTLSGTITPPQKDDVSETTPLLVQPEAEDSIKRRWRPTLWGGIRLFSVIHMLGMFAVWYAILRPLGYTLLRYLTERVVFLGIAAILSYFIIYVTSVGWFRYLYYEAFLGLHILFQVAALVFLFFHYPTASPYVLATFIIWAVDRILWRISLSSKRVIATLEVAPDEQTILVHCEIELRKKLFGIRSHLHHGWLPGQHVFLTIPALSFKNRFQTHPFTIASPAPLRDYDTTGVKVWPLQLVIRSINGFSRDLLEYAKHHQHCEVILDGPHGGVEALEAAHHADRVCFVAGGSGIAVTYPLAWDVRVKQDMQPDALVSTRTVYDFASGLKTTQAVTDCGPMARSCAYAHFWVRQDPRHAHWISMFPRAACVQGDRNDDVDIIITANDDLAKPDGHQEVGSIVTHAFDTRRSGSGFRYGSEGGRPDLRTEVWNWVTSTSSTGTVLQGDYCGALSSSTTRQRSTSWDVDRHSRPGPEKEKLCIVVSGPDGLVRDVRNVAARLVKEGWDLEVWVEKFGW